MSKTIFITGASRGFGRIWAEAFLKRGDKVAVAARNIDSFKELKATYGEAVFPVQLDVNNREESFAAIEKAKNHFGSIEILINNAGYALNGAIEETTEKEARAQFDTNFFGALWLTQAVLPIMREQKKGHIIQVSSILGLATLPILGLYNASKFALEGISETLATEVKSFGINITLVEPNGYASDIWNGGFQTQSMEIYDPVRKAFSEGATPDSFGKVEATAEAMLQLTSTSTPPLRLLLGKVALPFVKQNYEQRLALWEEWKEVSTAAHGH